MPKRIQRKRTKGWRMPEGKKCRKCGILLTVDNTFKSRVEKQDWICKKCHKRTVHDKWMNSLTDEEKSALYRRANLKRLGLTEEEICEIKEKQGHRCAICGRLFEETEKLINQFGEYDFVLDHDHNTGWFRALLCSSCNSMLGYARDDSQTLRAGAKYLEELVNKAQPVRLQMRRVKGFELQRVSRQINGLPAALVSRPTKWGNPFRVGIHGDSQQCVDLYRRYLNGEINDEDTAWRNSLYDQDLWCSPYLGKVLIWASNLETLRGKNLACWCPLSQTCHADVLLALANKKGEGEVC